MPDESSAPQGFLRSVRSRWKLRRCTRVGRAPIVSGRVWVRGPGNIRIGDGVVFDGSAFPIELHTLEPDSEIVIGDGAVIEGGTSIEAVIAVHVGDRARLGSFSKLMDNHFHSMVGDRHRRPPSAPVVVGPGAEIGPKAVLLAGAQVGAGAIVRAGTVLTRRVQVPPGRVARGIPAVLE